MNEDENVKEALKLINHTLKDMYSMLESHVREIDKHQQQIGRLIQCIGEFELTDAQRYYLDKAIRGG